MIILGFQVNPESVIAHWKLIRKYGLKRYRRYAKYYKKKMKGKYTDAFINYSDFYYPEDVGTTEKHKMKSGKMGIFEIFSVRGIDDFGSEKIHLDFIGYEETKPIRECTLEEFMELYDEFLIIK